MWDLPRQGSNPCPLHWQADSQPLHHQGSPLYVFINWIIMFSSWTKIFFVLPPYRCHPVLIKESSGKKKKENWTFGSRGLIKHICLSLLPPNIPLKWQNEHFQVLMKAIKIIIIIIPPLRMMRIKTWHIVLDGYYLHSPSTCSSKENMNTGILNPSCATDPFAIWWSPWTSSQPNIFQWINCCTEDYGGNHLYQNAVIKIF